MGEIEVLDLEPKRKKRKLKKKGLILIICTFLVLGCLAGGFLYLKKVNDQKEKEKQQQLLYEDIKKHYNKVVKVDKETTLYDKDMKEIGTIYPNQELELEEMEITYNSEYLKVKDLGMVKYSDVSPIDEMKKNDERYKNYIPFNKNVVLKEGYTLYDVDGNKSYSFKESKDYPIIINDYEDKYYVEYNNHLFYVLKSDVKEIIDHNNTTKKNVSRVTTLCYHRVYDTHEKCTDSSVCKNKKDFDQEMKYLKDNNYFTFTMEEMYLYLTGKLQIEKAVLVTLDDGWLVTSAIDVLEKYDLRATSFLKTKIWDDLTKFQSPSLELHSHTNDMHTPGVCKKEYSYQQGGGILCLSEEKVLADLKASRDKLNNPIALAYPFYDYNERAIKLVEKAGFKMAFIGAGSTNGKASPGVNLYKIPRMTIWDTTSFTKWKSYL